MTIIKASALKPDKSILEKKLLQDLEEGEPEQHTEVRVAVTNLHHQRRRCCFNLFMILLAMLVLAAGVISGIYLYKHLSKKIHKGKIRFYAEVEDHPYALPEKSPQKDGMMEPFPPKKPFHHKHHHFQPNFKVHRMHVQPVKVEQDVEIDENNYERIHMPKFGSFRETLVLHDFTKNYSGIVDFDEGVCYVMNLNRKKITPPRDWFDLIKKFASGYYMPKASVLKRKYRVAGGPIQDISKFGIYIQNECKNYNTYWLEKKVGNGLIEKRSTQEIKVFGYFSLDDTRAEHLARYEVYST